MHYQNEYEQAKYLARKRQNMFEQHYRPSRSNSKTKHIHFEDPAMEKAEGHDICGMLALIKANAAYIFPTAVTKHDQNLSTSTAKEVLDVIVSKGDGRYRALLFVRGDSVAALVGAYEDTVDAALARLLDLTCEEVGREVGAAFAVDRA